MCGTCHDKRYIRRDLPTSHPDWGKPVRCPECNPPPPAVESQDPIFDPGEKMRNCTFANFKWIGPQATAQEAYEAARRFAEQPEGWLVLAGKAGNGKTHLAVAILNHVAEQYGTKGLFVSVPDLLAWLREAIEERHRLMGRVGHNGRADTPELPSCSRRMDVVKTAPLLVLDDLGKENITRWTQAELFRLIDWRWRDGLPTVITTNTPPKQFPPPLASRLFDRHLARIVLNKAPDYRLKRQG